MGVKSKKEGKRRRVDKFYTLAKEQGYRARSAFKLIQLDKKYNFLSKARGMLCRCCAEYFLSPRVLLLFVNAALPLPAVGALAHALLTHQSLPNSALRFM